MEIIGEAVKNLPDSIKSSRLDVPWKQIAGMRDVLIHEYAGVRARRVWNTVLDDLPPFKLTVEDIRRQIASG
ncbi:MAG: DUF86 domain-containing protein [Candidatus Liptonbacteria bacterium]|nr:DUF86 domain-containing protein [Candidatus Liptonbacteria bacterium]